LLGMKACGCVALHKKWRYLKGALLWRAKKLDNQPQSFSG